MWYVLTVIFVAVSMAVGLRMTLWADKHIED